jgi:catechol 2,3-dioxygenase-like lactoylglutathione lyase family enzyme
MIEAHDVKVSAKFYSDLLGFKYSIDSAGMIGGQVMCSDECDLIILPKKTGSPPNPKHFALEVNDENDLERHFNHACEMGLNPRTMPQEDSPREIGVIYRGGTNYNNFYFKDPSGIILEIMYKL